MRTVTEAQLQALSAPQRTTHLRVDIDRGGLSGPEDWVDMTSLSGLDWVRSATWERSADRQIAMATVALGKRRYERSIAPLIDGSEENSLGTICALNNPVKIYTSVTAMYGDPDWIEVFDGLIDRVEWADRTVTLKCSDRGRLLTQRYTRAARKYPKDPSFSLAMESVLQEILDDEFSGGDAITLWSPNGTAGTEFAAADAPGFVLQEYVQERQSLMQALLAASTKLIGWRIGYRWQEDSGAHELQLWDPGREQAAIGTITVSGTSIVGTLTINTTTLSSGTDWTSGLSTLDAAAGSVADGINNDTTLQNEVLAWTDDAETAVGTATFSGQPSTWQAITINATTFTVGVDFALGSTVEDTIDNLIAAIRASAEDDNIERVWKRGVSGLKIKWGEIGAAGNSITFTSTLSNVTLDGGGTLGGSKAGIDARVRVKWLTRGTGGNGIAFSESVTNMTMDGSGTLGGTQEGRDLTVDQTFDQDTSAGYPAYYDITACSQDIADVRTVIDGTFTPRAVNSEPSQRTTITVEAAQSILDKYGEVFCSISEGETSPIDTETEMRRLLDAALADMEEPDLIKSVRMPLWWPVQNGDYYTFRANGDHYDSDQTLAVVSWSHRVSDGHGETRLGLRGKPSGGHKRWLRQEARGKMRSNDTYLHDGLSGVNILVGQGSITVYYDDPRTLDPPIMDWAWTEVHLSESGPNFTPSESTLRQRGKDVRFSITGLVPGVTYYGKILVITVAGTVGCGSAFVQEAAQKTTPYHTDQDFVGAGINPNPSLSVSVLGTDHAPDGWGLASGSTWGQWLDYDLAEHRSGGASVEVVAFPDKGVSSQAVLQGDLFPVEYLAAYEEAYVFRYTGTADVLDELVATLQMYDADKNLVSISSDSYRLTNFSAGSWHTQTARTVTKVLGLEVKWCRVYVGYQRVSGIGPTSTSITSLNFDSAVLRKGNRAFLAFTDPIGGPSIPSGAWTAVTPTYDTAGVNGYDYVDHYDGTTSTFTAPFDGVYRFTYSASYVTFPSGSDYRMRWSVNAGSTLYTGPASAAIAANDAPEFREITLDLQAGDTVTVEVYHNAGAAHVITAEIRGEEVVNPQGS